MPVLLLLAALLPQASRAQSLSPGAPVAVFTVDTARDQIDLDPGDGACLACLQRDPGSGQCLQHACTLRAAIQEANAGGGRHEIDFAVDSVRWSATLPAIVVPLTIDGQRGTSRRAVLEGTDPSPLEDTGLRFQGAGADGSIVKNVEVFGHATGLKFHDSDNHRIENTYIHHNLTDGLEFRNSGGNTVGGVLAAGAGKALVPPGNEVAHNGSDGVSFTGGGGGNTIQGNYVHDNAANGLYVRDTGGQQVGGETLVPGTGAGNVFSGNGLHGIHLDGVGCGGSVVEGNLIGTDPAGTAAAPNGSNGIRVQAGCAALTRIGGPAGGSRNVVSGNEGSGVLVAGGRDLSLTGNFIGTDAAGAAALGNGLSGVSIEGVGHVVGTPEAGNVVSGNGQHGVEIRSNLNTPSEEIVVQNNRIGTDAGGGADLGNARDGLMVAGHRHRVLDNLVSGNGGHGLNVTSSALLAPSSEIHVDGNRIGTDAGGERALGNTSNGITITGAPGNTIGLAAGNLISGNGANGLVLVRSDGNRIRANRVGTNAAGTDALPNGGSGIFVIASGNVIGGLLEEEANVVAFNGGDGIRITTGTGNTLQGNAVHGNGGLGIDLGGDGVTRNDARDEDEGPNDLQNFPLVASVDEAGGDLVVEGTLNSTPATLFRLDFYGNAADDGPPEGREYLGARDVTTDAAGRAVFSVLLPARTTTGAITVTATDPQGNTSEFSSPGLVVNSTGDLADTEPGDGACDTGGVVLRAGREEPECTLRAALAETNLQPGPDRIAYDIPATDPGRDPATGRFTIRPGTPLPEVVDPVELDGSTQPAAAKQAPATAPLIVLDGAGTAGGLGANGLALLSGSAGSRLSDHVIVRFELSGLWIGADSVVVERCFIGTDPEGNRLGNRGDGIFVNASGVRVGDADFEKANTIAYNGAAGIYVGFGKGNTFRRNAIYGNEGPGIDIDPPGPTPNDRADADDGANERQNYPRIDSVKTTAINTTLYGTMVGTPGVSYLVEVFFNTECDTTGYGEGRTSQWTTLVDLDAASDTMRFATTFGTPLDAHEFVTLTATDWNGNTSEFSRCWPKALKLLDVAGHPIREKAFVLSRVRHDVPRFTETTLDTLTTDADGLLYLRTPGLREGRDSVRVSRLMEREVSPKGHGLYTNAYTIHLDNAAFDSLTYAMSYDLVDSTIVQEVVLDHTTIAFNLLVSVEWDASLSYLELLEQGFRHAANYLYDVGDGQLRLDTVHVYDDRARWDEADVWVRADNTQWPEATVAGLYMSPASARLNMPRRWFGTLDDGRNLSVTEMPLDPSRSQNYRTIAHELGHYALGFFDEYLFVTDAGRDTTREARCGAVSNYGFMDNHYVGSGTSSSEMSWSQTYLDDACRNTKQYWYRKNSSWDDLEDWLEGERDGIPVPLLKPEERPAIGLPLPFHGPNNNFLFLDHDVGARVRFPVRHTPPARSDLTLRIVDRDGNGQPEVTVDQFTVDPPRYIKQGQTADDGRIVVLGAAETDSLAFSAKGLEARPGKAAEDDPFAWYTAVTTVDETVAAGGEVVLRPVAGAFPVVASAALTASGLRYDLTTGRAFLGTPALSVLTDAGAVLNPAFTPTAAGYAAETAADLSALGALTVWAVDDSARGFFFTNPYAVTAFTEAGGPTHLNGPGGDVTLEFEAAGSPFERGLVLSSGYPVLREGLAPGQLQAGRTHALSLLPAALLPTGAGLTIRYADGDPGAAPGVEQHLRAFLWDQAETRWRLVGGAVDTAFNEVHAPVRTPGVYALFTTTGGTGVGIEPGGDAALDGLPRTFRLHQSYPNPFNPTATIPFDVKAPVHVVLHVYDVLGRHVATVVDRGYAPGRYAATFDARGLPSGLYFYRITMEDAGGGLAFQEVRTMLLVK